MSTKGRSNRYINTKGSVSNSKKIGFEYAKSFNATTLNCYYKKHKAEFGSLEDKYDYAAKAIEFANRINKRECDSFINHKTGKTYKINLRTRELVIVSKKGIVDSYYIINNIEKFSIMKREAQNGKR